LLRFDGPAIVGPGGTILIRRHVHDEIGGYDERIKIGEDVDYCYRIARNYKVGFVPELLVNYRSHGANSRNNIREMERSLGLFYRKAFEDPDADVQRLRNEAYGNFHTVLAGSYFQSRSYFQFLRHSVIGLWMRPQNITRFIMFPFRRLGRQPE
jgi:GT2 family glycosyltransferase